MKVFISIILLFTLFIASYGQTPSPTLGPCDCDSYVQDDYPYNYTKSDLSGCLSGDDVCLSCSDNVCRCGYNHCRYFSNSNGFCSCPNTGGLAEGLGTILIVIIVIAVICGLCCIGGIIYCVCAGALCCAAKSGGSKNGDGQAQMATSTI
eukprot:438922_1